MKENHQKCEIRIHITKDREDNTKFTQAFIIKLLVLLCVVVNFVSILIISVNLLEVVS